MSYDGEDNITSLEQRASGRARLSPEGEAGRSAACGYHAPGRIASLAVISPVWRRKRRANPARSRDTNGLVGEPVTCCVAGNAAAEMRSLPAGRGKPNVRLIGGAGGN